MSIDIFIRTYRRDFPLLRICLYSIFKYVTSFRRIIIAVREKEYSLLMDSLRREPYFDKLSIVKEYNFDDSIDYLGQQITKLHADCFTDADYILFVDSDCVFHAPFDISLQMFSEETDNKKRIYLVADKFSDIDSRCLVWKRFLELCRLPSDTEFMRRLPLLYPSGLLKRVRQFLSHQRKQPFGNACMQVYRSMTPFYTFSEFNLIGAYARTYEPSAFCFVPWSKVTKEMMIPMKQIQHSQFKDNVLLQQAEMIRILKNP